MTPVPSITLTFGNESTAQITCKAVIKFHLHQYCDKIEFLVSDQLNYDLILGKPWHDCFHPTIDYSNNIMQFLHQGQIITLHPDSTPLHTKAECHLITPQQFKKAL